ncbi:MAG: hypothetical protein ACKOXU_02970, partial [Limnohabitans sp.]
SWVRSNLNRRPSSPLHIVEGTHEAFGVGRVTGLEINSPAIIKAGTVVRAFGVGQITGTLIRNEKDEK